MFLNTNFRFIKFLASYVQPYTGRYGLGRHGRADDGGEGVAGVGPRMAAQPRGLRD